MRHAMAREWQMGLSIFGECDFSDQNKVVFDETKMSLTLRKDASGKYPVGGDDIWVRLPGLNPLAAQTWFGFDAEYANKRMLGVVVTSLSWRMNNGSADRVWDGAAWVAPAPALQWNTHAEIQAGMPSWTAKTARPVVKLTTTSAKQAPELYRVRLGVWVNTNSSWSEIVHKGLVKLFKTNIRPVTDIVITWPNAATYNVGSLAQEEPVEIVNIDGVFNHATDPEGYTCLSYSYNVGTKVLTVTPAPTNGTKIRLRVIYRPDIAFSTHMDYLTSSKLPGLIIQEVEQRMVMDAGRQVGFVDRNSPSAAAKVVLSPRQFDIAFTVKAAAKGSNESAGLAEEAMRVVKNNPIVHVASMDSYGTVVLQGELTMVPSFDEANCHEATFGGMIRFADMWYSGVADGNGVANLNIDAAQAPN